MLKQYTNDKMFHKIILQNKILKNKKIEIKLLMVINCNKIALVDPYRNRGNNARET